MAQKNLKGIIQQTAQGRASYEIYEANSDFLAKLAQVLESHFGFQAIRNPLDGVDVIYWDFARDDIQVTLGWDIWSGCFVFATSEAGDEIIHQIGQYLEQVLHEL